MQSFKITTRTLPHWQQPGSVYFLTWRCKKGEVLSPEERTIALEALHYWDSRKWTLYAAVIMPDHVHALAQPLPSPQGAGVFDLAEIIHSNVGCVLRTIKWRVRRALLYDGNLARG